MFAETKFAIWRILLGADTKRANDTLLKERLLALRDDAGLWAVILSQGGHFAAAVFACGPRLKPNALDPKGSAAPLYQPVVHKTFHRYTVRYDSRDLSAHNHHSVTTAFAAWRLLNRLCTDD